jgi:hypothetical protein
MFACNVAEGERRGTSTLAWQAKPISKARTGGHPRDLHRAGRRRDDIGRFALIVMVAVGAVATVALASPDAPERRAHSPVRHVSGIEPDGLLVLGVLSPERAMVADPRTGTISERRLAGGTLCHGPLLAVGDRVVFSGSRGRRPIARSLPLSLSGPGRSLGRAEAFGASREPGRVWLGRWARPRRWTETATSRASLREVDAAGRPIARSAIRVPSWGSLEAVVDDGFVVAHDGGLSVRREGSVTRNLRDAWLVAAGRSRVAWCRPDGRGECRWIGIWRRGTTQTLHPPAGVRPHVMGRGAFSPSGRRLAVPVRTGGVDRVAVIDLTSGAWHVLPRRLADYRAIAWSPSGRWLYFTGARHRVLGWRAGGGRPVRLPIRTGATVMSIATTDALRG